MAGSNGRAQLFPQLEGNGADMLDRAAESVVQHGGALLAQAFSAEFLAALSRAAPVDRLASPELSGSLATTEFLAHPRVGALAQRVVGDGFNMGRLLLGALTSEVLTELALAGALYRDPHFNRQVPTIGLALLVPLAAASLCVWPGSHRADSDEGAVAVTLAAGAAFVFDVRLRVAPGAACALPALLAVYTRHWFREPRAADGTPAVNISSATYRRLPEAQRGQFSWRFDRYASRRPRLALNRAASHLPRPLMDLVSKVIRRG